MNTLSKSLKKRLQVSSLLNEYLDNKINDKVNHFSLNFSAYKVESCLFESNYSFRGKPMLKQEKYMLTLEECLEKLDKAVLDMGISNQTLDLYKKGGQGKSKKYNPVTVKDLLDYLRKEISTDN